MAEDYMTNQNDHNELFKPVDVEKPNYIKVIGVGGGGGNAVNHMMEEGIQGVDFVLCNTDHQALLKSKVKTTVHLGKRELGAGNDPNIGREAAEMSRDELEALMDDNTKMMFVTAGMGGGTGTGAAPVVAKMAKDRGILTVGIVTMPMEREGRRRKLQALSGIDELKKCVDTLILISTDKLRDQYGNMKLSEAFVGAVAPDDVGVVAAGVLGDFEDLIDFIERDFVGAGGDVEQDILCAFDVRVVEQGRVDGVLDGFLGAVLAFGDTGTHDSLTAVLHDGLHVLEVDVDISRDSDDFGDASCGGGQHVIGFLEGFGEFHVAVLVTQLVGADEDERVDAFLELVDACQSLQLAATAFSLHRHGDDTHGEDAFVFGQLGHHGSGTCSSATTHTCGDEQHLGFIIEQGFNLVSAHLGGFATDVRVVAGTQFTLPKVNGGLHIALQQGLMVSVAKDEIDTLYAFLHHVVDGIAAATAHTDDFNVVRLFHTDGLE